MCFGQTVGIFVEGGVYHAYAFVGMAFGERLDQFGGSVAYKYVVLLDAKVFCCQQRVDQLP